VVAQVVSRPVLEHLARGEARGVVRCAGPAVAYADIGGFVVALTTPGVPLMANGVTVTRVPALDGVVRARPGRIDAGAQCCTWDPARPPAWDPALRPVAVGDREKLGRRGDDILRALGSERLTISVIPAGREGIAALRAGVAARDTELAAFAADRLLGLGPGLTPEGDDLLAATAATTVAGGEPALAAALAPGDLRERTTPLSATLLELAAAGRISAPVHALLDLETEQWRAALRRLLRIGSSTGLAYAAGVGSAASLLAA
jgi:hypothetical protein